MHTTLMETAAPYLTPGRTLTLVAIPFGVLGVAVGLRALRAAGSSLPAVASSLIGAGLGAAIIATVEGGPGSGSGIVGAVIAVVLGVGGLVLSARAHLVAGRRDPEPQARQADRST